MLILQRLPAWLIFFTFFIGVVVLNVPRVQAAGTGVVISEALIGEDYSANGEFVELYNPSVEAIDITGWKLLYVTASGSTTKQLASLAGSIKPVSFMLFVSDVYQVPEGVIVDFLLRSSGFAASGGHIVLVDSANNEVDRIGWGDANQPEVASVGVPAPGLSLMRINLATNQIADTNNNQADFQTVEPNPNGGGFVENVPEYKTVFITELFPDPAAPLTDTKDEFIELFNPNNESANLSGYILQSGSNFQYEYLLPEINLAAGQYAVFYSEQTNLTLANSSSRARILDPSRAVIHETKSYSGVGESYAWALNNEADWEVTETPTPGTQNIIKRTSDNSAQPGDKLDTCPVGKFRNPLTNRCKKIAESKNLKPCRSDQFRNPATNRCKLISSTVNSLKPCAPSQFRNPATNRCKAIGLSASTLKPCAADQFRNPATNRCKKIDSGSSLKPCGEGEERNPQTNRCRKVGAAVTTNPLTNPAVASSRVNMPAILLVSMLAIGYGIYEYRQEIWLRLRKAVTSSPPQ